MSWLMLLIKIFAEISSPYLITIGGFLHDVSLWLILYLQVKGNACYHWFCWGGDPPKKKFQRKFPSLNCFTCLRLFPRCPYRRRSFHMLCSLPAQVDACFKDWWLCSCVVHSCPNCCRTSACLASF